MAAAIPMLTIPATRTTSHLLQRSLLLQQSPRLFSSASPSRLARSGSLTQRSTPAFIRPQRQFSSTSALGAGPVFAKSVDRETLSARLELLLEQKQWTLDEERAGVAKTYYFKTYTKCLDFTQVVGIRSKSKNHHSIMTLKSGSVHIHWTTHFPRGITDKDIDMAEYCDQQAALIGTVEQNDANKCRPAK